MRVSGGLGSFALSMSAMAAVQLPWQSKRALMIPPLMMPGNAWYFLSKRTVAERPLLTLKLFRCSPSSAAGPADPRQITSRPDELAGLAKAKTCQRGGDIPQPKQLLFGV